MTILKLTPEQIEAQNAEAAFVHACLKDTLAKRWYFAPMFHPSVFRALKIDPKDPAASYATLMCRLMRIEGRPVVAIAWPCPDALLRPDLDDPCYIAPWLCVTHIIAWDPAANHAFLPEDDQPQVVGSFPDPTYGTVYADPFKWVRAWVEARARFFARYEGALAKPWEAIPEEADRCPGMLAIGALDKIRWPLWDMPGDLTVVGAAPKALNNAILRSAKLPFARTGVRVEV